jgi:hypothetical protein
MLEHNTPRKEAVLMPTHLVEIVTSGRKVFKIKGAESEEQAKDIAVQRHEQNAPIDLVKETSVVTEINIVNED